MLAPVQKNVSIPLSQLSPHARNYRSHPPEQLSMLQASLRRFNGQVRSIVVQQQGEDAYTIVAGRGVVLAAQSLVDTGQYPHLQNLRCDLIDASWPAHEVEAYLVADNNLNQFAADDEDLLNAILIEQAQGDYDLAALGCDDETMRQLMSDKAFSSDKGEEEENQPTIPGLDAPDLPYKNQFAVAVLCASEMEQQSVFEFLQGQGYTCKILVV